MQYCSKTYEIEKGKKCHLLKVAMLKRIATHLIQIFLNSYDDFSQHIQDWNYTKSQIGSQFERPKKASKKSLWLFYFSVISQTIWWKKGEER